MTTDDLLARAEKRLFATATDPYDDGDNPWATLVADLAAEVRALTARLDTARPVVKAVALWINHGRARPGRPDEWWAIEERLVEGIYAAYEAATADPTPHPETCTHANRAWTIGGPEDSDGYVWCPDCRTNLTVLADDDPHYPDHQWVWVDGNNVDAVVIYREWQRYQRASSERWESESNEALRTPDDPPTERVDRLVANLDESLTAAREARDRKLAADDPHTKDDR